MAQSARELDQALHALADANRRAILAVAQNGPRSVGEIAEATGLSQQTTSHHLKVLRGAGLTTATRSGTRHLYALNTDGLAAVRDYLDGFWPAKLEALKTAVESSRAAPAETRAAPPADPATASEAAAQDRGARRG